MGARSARLSSMPLPKELLLSFYWIIAVATVSFVTEAECQNPPGGERDVILGVAGGILNHSSEKVGVRMFNIRTFLISLRVSGSRARVVFFTGEDHTGLRELAEEQGAEIVLYDVPEVNSTHGPFFAHRYFLYQEFLRARHQDFDRVMITDTRDVLFQRDPFESIPMNDGLAVAIEANHVRIIDCFWHKYWLLEACPLYREAQVLGAIGQNPRSCSGTTLGTTNAMLTYLELMLSEFQRLFDPKAEEWCNDQAIHNYLVYTGKLEERGVPLTKYAAESSMLVTLGDLKNFTLNEEDEVINAAGDVPAVVHQYDRSPHLNAFLHRQYGNDEYVVYEVCPNHPRLATGPDGPQVNIADKHRRHWEDGNCMLFPAGTKDQNDPP